LALDGHQPRLKLRLLLPQMLKSAGGLPVGGGHWAFIAWWLAGENASSVQDHRPRETAWGASSIFRREQIGPVRGMMLAGRIGLARSPPSCGT